jgi:hypothetical protein
MIQVFVKDLILPSTAIIEWQLLAHYNVGNFVVVEIAAVPRIVILSASRPFIARGIHNFGGHNSVGQQNSFMSDHYRLTEHQLERIKPYFPRSHTRPRVDDRRVISRIIRVIQNGQQMVGCAAR